MQEFDYISISASDVPGLHQPGEHMLLASPKQNVCPGKQLALKAQDQGFTEIIRVESQTKHRGPQSMSPLQHVEVMTLERIRQPHPMLRILRLVSGLNVVRRTSIPSGPKLL